MAVAKGFGNRMKECCICKEKKDDIICISCLSQIIAKQELLKDLLFVSVELRNANHLLFDEILLYFFDIVDSICRECKINETEYTGTLREAELAFRKNYVSKIMNDCNGNTLEAGKRLGLSKQYLWTLKKNLGIK